jgi:hypothetical protein
VGDSGSCQASTPSRASVAAPPAMNRACHPRPR